MQTFADTYKCLKLWDHHKMFGLSTDADDRFYLLLVNNSAVDELTCEAVPSLNLHYGNICSGQILNSNIKKIAFRAGVCSWSHKWLHFDFCSAPIEARFDLFALRLLKFVHQKLWACVKLVVWVSPDWLSIKLLPWVPLPVWTRLFLLKVKSAEIHCLMLWISR